MTLDMVLGLTPISFDMDLIEPVFLIPKILLCNSLLSNEIFHKFNETFMYCKNKKLRMNIRNIIKVIMKLFHKMNEKTECVLREKTGMKTGVSFVP